MVGIAVQNTSNGKLPSIGDPSVSSPLRRRNITKKIKIVPSTTTNKAVAIVTITLKKLSTKGACSDACIGSRLWC